MPAPPPEDGDRPATRRDLEQLRHSFEATVRAEIADHRADTTQEFRKVDQQFAKVTEEFRKVTEEFRKVDQRIADLAVTLAEGLAAANSRVSEQTRVLIVAMVLMFGATIGIILRTG